MEEMSYRYSNEQQVGDAAYDKFVSIAERKGYEVKKSTRNQDMYDHIDLYLTKNEITVSLDVKAKKKINRYDSNSQSDYTYVEFQNVRGNKGWLYGKADIIAFETDDTFVLVEREGLASYCEKVVDFKTKVGRASESLYKIYSRSDRNDLISMIELGIIPCVIKRIWKK